MVTISTKSVTSTSFIVEVDADSGETLFDVEINRAEDFASDDSFIQSNVGFGDRTFAGLPSDTVWSIRARKTNGGIGLWTPVIKRATLPAPANAPNLGLTVDKALLVRPEQLSQILAPSALLGAPAKNLLRDDPMSAMRVNGSGTFAIQFETAGRPMDAIALLGTLAGIDATWRIRAAASQAALASAPTYDTGYIRFHASPNLGARELYHGLHLMAAPRTDTWWEISITHAAPAFVARNLVVGLQRKSVNASRGSGQTAYDLGSMSRTSYGTPQRVEGWKGRRVDFELSWLSETEYQTKWSDLEMTLGLTRPVMVLPNSRANQYLHDRIGFGCISSTRSEVMRGDKSLRQITVDSLY